ncbi:response regulator [Sphingobacterium chuzhouense]|nr:response regulator [Sphingobacterium chuzhouense]
MKMKTQKVILLVDDDIRNIFALQLTLKARKYNFVSTQNAMEGLQLLQSNPEIGLVLLDMMMPEMDGYEAIKQIRSSDVYGSVPIVAVTANAMSGDKEKCIAAGADNYIAKPIDVDRLMKVIEELL